MDPIMEKHAALELAFTTGFLDELEKVATERGLSDIEKLALLGQAGKLVGRGISALGRRLGTSGAEAGRKSVEQSLKGLEGGELRHALSMIRQPGDIAAGATRRSLGKGVRDLGQAATENARLTGGLALGGAGLGAAGLGGAALS